MTSTTLLNAATVAGAGPEADTDAFAKSTVFVKTSGTVSGTLAIQIKSPLGDWHTVHSVNYTTAGNQDPIHLETPAFGIRANLTAYTSGTFDVSAIFDD